MAITSASLKEIEDYINYLQKKSIEIEEYLETYQNKVKNLVESTTGGSKALGESGITAVQDALEDIRIKMASAKEFLNKAYKEKGGVIKEGFEAAENTNY